MPPKAKVAAPIDRPISRAYLREFSGWSTAYPPGMSEPTSLRQMENLMVNRDGSVRVRPGLRYLSYATAPTEVTNGVGYDRPMVGTHEVFYLNDGSKAYLFAVREANNSVGFRVLKFLTTGTVVQTLTQAGFTFPVSEANVAFTDKTTYVKYLQIDNKIWALSDAGETMRLFNVGAIKTAKRINAILQPTWTVADKPRVIQPDGTYITDGGMYTTRVNLSANPRALIDGRDPFIKFSIGTGGLFSAFPGGLVDVAEEATVGTNPAGDPRNVYGYSLPERTNRCPYPLHALGSGGSTAGWNVGFNSAAIQAFSVGLTTTSTGTGPAGRTYSLNGPLCAALEGDYITVSLDLTQAVRTSQVKMLARWYNSSNVQIGADVFVTGTTAGGRVTYEIGAAPVGCVAVRIYPTGLATTANQNASFSIRNVMVENSSGGAYFSGSSGTNYFWLGTTGASQSVYHPPQPLYITHIVEGLEEGVEYIFSAYAKGSTARNVRMSMRYMKGFLDPAGAVVDGTYEAELTTWSGATRVSVKGVAPAGTTYVEIALNYNASIPRNEKHYISAILAEEAGAEAAWFDGDKPDSGTVEYNWSGDPGASPSSQRTFTTTVGLPPKETPTTKTLIGAIADPDINEYNVGVWYTFENEVGETWPSQVKVVRTQRPWSGWLWQLPNSDGEPNGTETDDPKLAADQLVLYPPAATYNAAKAAGATRVNFYMMTWSDQAPVPVEGVKVDSKEIKASSTHATDGWGRMTPQLAPLSADTAPVPNESARYNYSEPSSAGNGVVAADRMVMVLDPAKAAVIKWSSNNQGDYTNFTASKGGGYKTLTAGNLFVPAAVKLWQNPESKDTLTILCQGTDGRSTGYYMAPAQVASQSSAVNIMGFEETTATPGTVAPYGVEVFNNTLYHPVESELMKSTASNYNINHKSVTDQIENMWRRLQQKVKIVSSQHNNRLYYIVNNPLGEPLQPGCRGNEVWVYDGASEAGTWSRWLVQAITMREIEQGGRTYMSIVRPDGIYYFDPDYSQDDYVAAARAILKRNIGWKLQTNTQGANRAHDAWAHVTQLAITLGNFTGNVRWGIRSWDINGKAVEIAKKTRDLYSTDNLPWDYEDYLRIGRDLKEWLFFAESIPDEDGLPLPSAGQINLVQYRYTPVSVNVGYEYGSVETFEYQRAAVNWAQRTTDNGVPTPFEDVRRP